ncbi:MAG: FAD-binding oxidoreductase [Acidobacteria bacterium]|nr:FAD-binding oxidoreductase [Acidobacteriota bacterium]
MSARRRKPLPASRLEWFQGWGKAVGAAGYAFRPSDVAGIRHVLERARDHRVPLVLRGAGRSYGDAALLAEAVILGLERMNRVLAWDPTSGVMDVEPGVTIDQVWRRALPDGWWPPVVTGTATPSIGGVLSMNAHGKNNWVRGTTGEHCEELDLLLPSGEIRTLTPAGDPELFHAVIGGFGQLGIMTRARLRLMRVHSGLLEVQAVSARNMGEMLRLLDEAKDRWEYVVGWIDAFAGGRRLGRGLLHFARHLDDGEDVAPAKHLDILAHEPPRRIAGVLPVSVVPHILKPLTNRPGLRLINRVKYEAGRLTAGERRFHQSVVSFSFLLDAIPGWERIYEPGGLIQHQSFVPVSSAERVFVRQLELCRKAGMPSFLAVLKRHRPDPFLLTHGLDGFSLALDFPVTAGNRDCLWGLVRELAEPVVEAGGRFYPAKDAALPGELFRAAFTDGQLDRFARLKRELDPGSLLRSSLADRLLAPLQK